MGIWLLYAEGENTQSIRDDQEPVATWLIEHRGLYCVGHEGDAFRYDYTSLPDQNADGERQLPRAIFLQRERDAKLFPARSVTFEEDMPDIRDERYDLLEGATLTSIMRAVRGIEREYGTFDLPNQVRRPPRPDL